MVWYLLGINILTFIVYGIDKYNAIKKKYRISEYSLFAFSVIGGSIGSLLGMRLFHHKTKKKFFWIVNILSSIIWLIIIILHMNHQHMVRHLI